MTKVDWYLSPWYKGKMERYWYFFFWGWKAFNLAFGYAAAVVANLVSPILFLIFFLILGYVVIDAFMCVWDFSDDFFIYVDAFWTLLILFRRVILHPESSITAKVKSIF